MSHKSHLHSVWTMDKTAVKKKIQQKQYTAVLALCTAYTVPMTNL